MSVTRTAARRALGPELGPFGVFTATTGSVSTASFYAPFQNTQLGPDAYAYHWIYVPTIGSPQVRRIAGMGLEPNAGTLTFDGALGPPGVQTGTEFELSAKLPGARDVIANLANIDLLGLNEALALAARHILMDQDDLAVPLVSGQREYDLSGYPWLDRSARLKDVLVPDALGLSYRPTPRRFELVPSGTGSVLRFEAPFRFTGSYSMHLAVKRPGDTLVKVGSTWTETTGGAATEASQYGLELNQLIPVALAFCYAALRDRATGPTRAQYGALYEQQVAVARRVHNYDTSNDIAPQVAGGGGPAAGPVPAALAEAIGTTTTGAAA
jgi:hypothetical protein